MDKKLYNLTNPQLPLWQIEQFYENTSINNVGGIMYIHEKVDFIKLEQAINLAIKNNDGLRIKLDNSTETVMQYIDSFEPYVAELLIVNDESTAEGVKCVVKEPFTLFNAPLQRIKMFQSANGENGFVVILHHLISDAWTINFVGHQILAYYKQLVNGADEEIINYSYETFIETEQNYLISEKFIQDKLFWEEKFNCLPDVVSLKTEEKFSIDAKRKEFVLSGELVEKINLLCSENKISQYIFLLSLYSIYFRNILNTTNYIIGNPILNRTNYKEKHTVGAFINTVPFVVKMNDTDSFLQNCINLSADQKKMYRHIRYPFTLIQQYIKNKHSVTAELFDIVFSYQNAKITNFSKEDSFSSEWVPNESQVQSLMVHVKDTDNTGKIFINYDYLLSAFSENEIDLMHERILNILNQVLENHNMIIKDIEIITSTEKQKLLYDLNNTNMEYDKTLTIVDMFEKQVEKTPDNIAVTSGENSLTYKELNSKANFLAIQLRNLGVNKQDIVGIYLNRSENIIISILAILKLGAIYMPIDPEYPAERIKIMLDNSQTKTIISTAVLAKEFSDYNLLVIDDLDYYDFPNMNTEIDSDFLAYIMYTSGSTGIPKAVCIKHYNVVNYTKSMQKKLDYNANSDNKVLSVTTMCFDIFVFEVFPTLLSGLQLVIANEFESKNPEALSNLILEKKICKFLTTPSRVQLLFLDNKYLDCLKQLKEILLGGEPFPLDMLPKLQELTTAKICNLYGPTETTVYSAYKDLTHEKEITIGTPIDNTQIYILNENNKLLPHGAIGEICIAGDGVGGGYYKNTELTEKVFIENPYKESDIVYKTGDLGKWLDTGELLCLGRSDFQIKIRGYRVELGDIVSNILTYPNIDKAVVIDREDKKGEKYLCAYIVSKRKIKFNSLQKYLAEKLPNYMVPSRFMQIEEIPLTLNHKVNRKALPEPEANDSTKSEYVAPVNDVQKKVCEVIAETLSIERIGITNDIFDYQVDSLAIITIQTKPLQQNIKLNIQDFYEYRTVEKIVETHSAETEETEELYLANSTFKKHSEIPVALVQNEYKNILLLGSTGYFGIHLLHELVSNTEATIYCLVRNKGNNNSQKRLIELYEYFFNENLEEHTQVKIIEADILKKDFGLDKATYKFIAKNVDYIINSAANVKYFGNAKAFKDINVGLTKRLSEFCIANNIKLSYVSTLGVSGHLLASQRKLNNVFTEDNFYIGQKYKDNIYVQTKFEAEKVIYENVPNGLNASIFRVGNLTGRYADGFFQKNVEANAFYNILKSIVSYGIIPKSLLDKSLEFTPVDLATLAFCKLMFNVDTDSRVFHVFNNKYIVLSDLLNILNDLGFDVKVLDDLEYKKELSRLSEYNIANTLINGVHQDIETLFNTSVIEKNDYSNELLEKNGFAWKEIDREYIEKIIGFIKKIGFI